MSESDSDSIITCYVCVTCSDVFSDPLVKHRVASGKVSMISIENRFGNLLD